MMFRPNPYGKSPAERLNWLCYTSGGAPDVMKRFLERDLEREQRQAMCALNHELMQLKSALREVRLSLSFKAGFNPNQPRDDQGRWTVGGDTADEPGPDSDPTDIAAESSIANAYAPDGTRIEPIGGFEPNDTSKSVQKFVSEKCQASVGRRIDKPMLDLTIGDMLRLAAQGDPMAVRCRKILMQDRFRK
jgi:hypothetical protein